jgi:signal transduction histidine kinase
MSETLGLIDQLTREFRTISHLLHPPLLDELGLVSALRWFVEGFSDRAKIPVSLELASDFGRVSRDLETTVFRIVQECLTNIHRHSKSPSAKIRIVRDEANVIVEVQDFGKGIPPSTVQGESRPLTIGVGIQGMRERVRQLGGRFELISDPSGTTIRATMPVLIPGARATTREDDERIDQHEISPFL